MMIDDIKAACAAMRQIRSKGGRSINLHGLSFESAAELFEAGFVPCVYTNNRDYSGWTSYYSLSRDIDGVTVNLFTVRRPATEDEIAVVNKAAVEVIPW